MTSIPPLLETDIAIMDLTAPVSDNTASTGITSLAGRCAALQPGSMDVAETRKNLVAIVKDVLATELARLERTLLDDGDGRACAAGLSQVQDAIITALFDFVTARIYRSSVRSAAEHMTVVATGGYGRGLLAPRSDIDLLFLLPYKQTPWGESVAELILYVLWDAGLKVGHATRSVDQCVALARADMTIRTALLDARIIVGSRPLFEQLQERFRKDVAKGTGREFIESKLAERDQRHARAGESRYLVEPNVKDGKGGIRDLHTLHWLLKYLHGIEPDREAVAAGLFTAEEYRTFRRCEDFLWTVRCNLHFVTKRAEERLSFDLQPVLAERLGYRQRGALRAVERFMKHYFLVAREVGLLTLVVCAGLELQQVKAAPSLAKLLSPLTWRARRIIRRRTDFRVENDRLTFVTPEVFRQNPVNILRLFKIAQEFDVGFHPDVIRLVRQSLRLIDDTLRANAEANRVFLEILTAQSGVERVLRQMNEAGVLGRFLPEFGKVVGMMQFNMYHSYTVDEHLIRSVGLLSQIEAGTLGDDHPLATQIVHEVQHRRALYVAVLLHDVGKRQDGDHSLNGAAMARIACPRLGLSKAESDTVAWLIEWHLVMSTFAQSRDINDPKTVRDFADIVQGPERLRLLLVLTVADIRAVGPGVWNGWKGQLLRTLYANTEPLLAGDVTALGKLERGQAERIRQAQHNLQAALKDWPSEEVQQVIARHRTAYWLTTALPTQVKHAQLMRRERAEQLGFAFDVTTDAFTAVTELTVLARDVPRLLALFAGACAAAGADIMGAQISTTTDDFALDTFQLRREMDEDSERRRGARIGETIGRLIRGETTLEKIMERKNKPVPKFKAFRLEPEVMISNTLSDRVTVIEVAGLDRSGLLYDVTAALSDLGLDIHSAHISTFGERVVDVFYVTDLAGGKVVAADRQTEIRERLYAALGAGR